MLSSAEALQTLIKPDEEYMGRAMALSVVSGAGICAMIEQAQMGSFSPVGFALFASGLYETVKHATVPWKLGAKGTYFVPSYVSRMYHEGKSQADTLFGGFKVIPREPHQERAAYNFYNNVEIGKLVNFTHHLKIGKEKIEASYTRHAYLRSGIFEKGAKAYVLLGKDNTIYDIGHAISSGRRR